MALEAARGGSLFLLIQAETASRFGLIHALGAVLDRYELFKESTMASYNVLLKFDGTEANSAREAAEIIFKTYFSESFFQPAVLDVVEADTGEAEKIEVDDLRNGSPLYGHKQIAEILRSKASITVEDLFSVGDDAVVLGRISRGVIRIGDKMQTEINGVSYVANVERIETLGSGRDIGYFTETVGLFFKEEHANNFVAGTVLTAASA